MHINLFIIGGSILSHPSIFNLVSPQATEVVLLYVETRVLSKVRLRQNLRHFRFLFFKHLDIESLKLHLLFNLYITLLLFSELISFLTTISSHVNFENISNNKKIMIYITFYVIFNLND